jgi:hypothetical protein
MSLHPDEARLEKKFNDELRRLCQAHGINNRWSERFMLLGCLGPTGSLLALLLAWLQSEALNATAWWTFLAIAASSASVTVIALKVLGRQRANLNRGLRRCCREAVTFGYFVVLCESNLLDRQYPYELVLAVTRSPTPESSDEAFGRAAPLEAYPDPHGLAGMLAGYSPPKKHKTH